MKIINMRPSAGSNTLAVFDVEIDDRIRVFDVALRRNAKGELRAFAPSPGSRHTVTFTPAFADEIIKAAGAAIRSRLADDNTAV